MTTSTEMRTTLLAAAALLVTGCSSAAPADPLEPAGRTDEPAARAGDGGAGEVPSDGAGGAGPTSCPRPGGWTIDDPRITESSGMALSRVHPGVLYTHNDAGNAPSVFAVDASGTRAVLDLAVLGVDWEDVATTPDGRLWVGDIGDNDEVRGSVSVAVVEEPDVLTSTTLAATTYELQYEDGPHDAEALLVDPRDDRVWVVTKEEPSGTAYVAPVRLREDRVNVLRAVSEAPAAVSGGAFSPDGERIVLRTQRRAFFGDGFRDETEVVDLPQQRQGEAVTFTEDGRWVLLGSEGENSRVLCLPVPGAPGG
ncbi:hypothetical protein [Nocardioides sp. CFH 31398]|uniref:hypothetical protein n=1 Tax=Nocardioides sp. CFH 31398 TaxID=2919579 RepID=UPI001F061FCD|nr:hypothetical protein [Nocardioides sp. CFH 31398]MCH1867538.1 hypothetical protein [Nocardioides sp. CFH 31398]